MNNFFHITCILYIYYTFLYASELQSKYNEYTETVKAEKIEFKITKIIN